MDDATKKALERLKLSEELLGPEYRAGKLFEKLQITQPFGLEPSALEKLQLTSIASEFVKMNHEWDTVTERLRELSLFKAIDGSSVAKLVADSQLGLAIDDSILKTVESAVASLQERFRLPQFAELQSLQERLGIALAPFAAQGAVMQANIDRVQELAKSLKTPWLDSQNVSRSFDGFAGLASLGFAIRTNPYSPTTIEAVAAAIGTWSTIPEEAEEDPFKRDEFYEEHGLNTDLIAIPEPAFTEALERTGVVSTELLVAVEFPLTFEFQESLTSDEVNLLRRLEQAASLLQVFEIKLRAFIHETMSAEFKSGWEKHRLPENGEMHQRWSYKREKAVKNGEQPEDLIHYADFTDYAKLITREDNWKQVFSRVFPNKDLIRLSFSRLEQLRLPVMHSRRISKADLMTIGTETTQILIAIGVLKRD